MTTQSDITPEQALLKLKEGNQRFLTRTEYKYDKLLRAAYTAKTGQFPFAIVLSCMDSRSIPEIIFDQSLGDIFTIRVAGNVVNKEILASMEYGVKFAGSKLILVKGHTHCGAVTAACKHHDHPEHSNLNHLLNSITPAVISEKAKKMQYDNTDFINNVAKTNVFNSIAEIKSRSPILNDFLKQKKIMMLGGIHDLATGKVNFFDQQENL